MARIRGAAAVFAFLAALGASGAAQKVETPPIAKIKRDLKQYHGLILDYRGGSDAAVREVLSWDRARILAALGAIETGDDDIRPWEKSRFKAAAMMHTDAALQLIDEVAESEGPMVHLDAASRLLQKAGPEIRQYTSRWPSTRSAPIDCARRSCGS